MKVIESVGAEQMSKGLAVEREHQPTYDRLVEYMRLNGGLPPAEWLFAGIARDHLENEDPRYYDRLEATGL